MKNGLRFHSGSETSLNYPILNVLLVLGMSSQNSSGFSSHFFSIELGPRRLIKDLSSEKTLLFLDEVKLDEENRYLEKLAIRVGEGDVGNVDLFMALSPWNTGFVMDSYGNPQHHRDGQQYEP